MLVFFDIDVCLKSSLNECLVIVFCFVPSTARYTASAFIRFIGKDKITISAVLRSVAADVSSCRLPCVIVNYSPYLAKPLQSYPKEDSLTDDVFTCNNKP